MPEAEVVEKKHPRRREVIRRGWNLPRSARTPEGEGVRSDPYLRRSITNGGHKRDRR